MCDLMSLLVDSEYRISAINLVLIEAFLGVVVLSAFKISNLRLGGVFLL